MFASLFDQESEPNLLADEVLFRRIPVAYGALSIARSGLAWLVDHLQIRGVMRGAGTGACAGIALVAMGVVSLWTAIDMTGAFVGAAALVQVSEMAAASAALGACAATADRRPAIRWTLGIAFALAVLGIVVQNLM